MGNRISRIYTRTGDVGDTGTADGSRIAKDDMLIVVQGDLDELNSFIGLLVNKCDTHKELLLDVQHDLFDIGGEISLGQPLLKAGRVKAIESAIDALNDMLEPLKEFILPGGSETGAVCHITRAVCRRVERHMVSLSRERDLNPESCAYINRLSDLLFVLARSINGGGETYWRSDRLNQQD